MNRNKILEIGVVGLVSAGIVGYVALTSGEGAVKAADTKPNAVVAARTLDANHRLTEWGKDQARAKAEIALAKTEGRTPRLSFVRGAMKPREWSRLTTRESGVWTIVALPPGEAVPAKAREVCRVTNLRIGAGQIGVLSIRVAVSVRDEPKVTP